MKIISGLVLGASRLEKRIAVGKAQFLQQVCSVSYYYSADFMANEVRGDDFPPTSFQQWIRTITVKPFPIYAYSRARYQVPAHHNVFHEHPAPGFSPVQRPWLQPTQVDLRAFELTEIIG